MKRNTNLKKLAGDVLTWLVLVFAAWLVMMAFVVIGGLAHDRATTHSGTTGATSIVVSQMFAHR